MPTIVKDELERATTYEYDDLDRLTKVISPDPGNGQDIPVVEYAYTLSGLIEDVARTFVEATSGDEIITHYEFDDNGRVQHVFDDYGGADEAETVYEYDDVGNVVGIQNALLQHTKIDYDVLNRPVRITKEDPDGAGPLAAPDTYLAYDDLGRQASTVDSVGQVRRSEYDELGRVLAAIAPLGVVSRMAYDAAGQLVRRADPMGRTSFYAYDDAGRLASMREPGHENPTTYQYDSANNLRFVIDPLSHESETAYDERGRVTDVIAANGDTTTYTYTDANELETLTDGENNTTTWVYDGAGRVASETNELADARTFKYDGFGRLSEKIDRNERTTTYEYDRLNHLTDEDWWIGSNVFSTISYDFDAIGNLESVSDANATYEYAYDDLNRQIGVTQTIAGLTPTITFARQYDAAGRLASNAAAIGATDDFLSDYVYDALGRVATLIQTDQNENAVADMRVDFTYNPDSQFASILRYAGTTTASPVASTEFTYDSAGRIDLIHHLGLAAGSTYDEEHHYAYDDADRLTSYENLIDEILAEYDYDAAGQLTAADYDALLPDETYDYDDNGNRDQDITNSAGTFDYVFDVNNRLVNDGIYTYEYDQEGNRTLRTEIATGNYTEYRWDFRNRLTEVYVFVEGVGEFLFASYVYDAFNQLIGAYYQELMSPTSQSLFVHDSGQVVLQFDRTTTGSFAASDLSHRYVWGPGVDQLLADEQIDWTDTDADGPVYWAMTDHLGTVRDVIDSNGDLRIHRQFDSFGNVVDEAHYNTSGAVVTSGQAGYVDEAFAFTGRWRDNATGLQNNLHRWYDALVGAWLSEDPIGFNGDASNLNRYGGNQPTLMVDPSGLGYNLIQGAIRTFGLGALGAELAAWLTTVKLGAVAATTATVAAGGAAVAAAGIGGYKLGGVIDDAGLNPLAPVAVEIVDAWHWITSDDERVQQQRDRRRLRRERESRLENGQNQSGTGYRKHDDANKGPRGERPRGPGGRNRERNRGIDEEHSRVPKGPRMIRSGFSP